ncbi:hypothetical protein GCM10011490_13350 [Pseudoclavibacter endophyticus]|nr:acyltransferase [Pseudoclavibacter endophyticus]GGA64032.1 hypothetical protein GCM10011490_13350 [Pseudoclavibacter endophyticus]
MTLVSREPHAAQALRAERSGSAATASTPSRRDSTIDVARAWCLVVVVALHAMMVGVSVVGGAPLLENAMEGWGGFAAATWFVQVMPLFFVLGGASAMLHWRKLRRGQDAPGRDGGGVDAGAATRYVATRVPRLVVPALVAGIAVVAALTALLLLGVPGDLVAEAGFRMSQPLWFLGVYVLCSAAVPFLATAHRRAPGWTLGALIGAAVGVDALRHLTGVEAIGFANLLFVWLAVQQLGFFVADGTSARLPRRWLVPLAAAAFAGLALLCGVGVAPFDLLEALNPPSAVLIMLGVGQLLLFEAARPWLQAVHARGGVAAVVGWINARAMTIYSWHMLVLIGLAGGLLVTGWPLPAPLSTDWWATRPLWLVAVVAVVTVVVALAGRFEAKGRRPPSNGASAASAVASMRRVWFGGAVAAAGTLAVLVGSGSLLAWAIGATAWIVALLLVGARPRMSIHTAYRPGGPHRAPAARSSLGTAGLAR